MRTKKKKKAQPSSPHPTPTHTSFKWGDQTWISVSMPSFTLVFRGAFPFILRPKSMWSNFSEESYLVPKSRQPAETGQPPGCWTHPRTILKFRISAPPLPLKCKASGSWHSPVRWREGTVASAFHVLHDLHPNGSAVLKLSAFGQ